MGDGVGSLIVKSNTLHVKTFMESHGSLWAIESWHMYLFNFLKLLLTGWGWNRPLQWRPTQIAVALTESWSSFSALGYNSVGLSLRRRKSSSSQNYNKLRTKSRARRPTHIYNEWRNQPDQVSTCKANLRAYTTLLCGCDANLTWQFSQRFELSIVWALKDINGYFSKLMDSFMIIFPKSEEKP